jgi:hypothetical protein
MTDDRGHFSIANVPKGSRKFAAQHDVIDALGMSGITASANVTDGAEPVRLVVPSFSKLWAYACGRPAPATDSGMVFGTVHPGAKRFTRATVAVSWVDVAPKGMTVNQTQKILQVDTDSTGGFALCGVPTGAPLTIKAEADSVESGTFDVDPLQSERVMRRDLTITSRNGVAISGRVISDSTGAPIAGADVILDELYQSARTSPTGEFLLPGVPAGTHLLRIRRPGFTELSARFDVEDTDLRTPDLIVPRVSDSDAPIVATRASISPEQLMPIFTAARQAGKGYFVTRDQLDASQGRPVPELMQQWPGVKVVRSRDGHYALMTQREKGVLSALCRVPAFVNDGLEPEFDINDFQAQQLEAIAYYPAGMVPKEYDIVKSKCGVLTVITRR